MTGESSGMRHQQIEQLVDELAGRIGRCEEVDLASVRRDYGELMPELGERLRVLEGIQRAAFRVRDEGPRGIDDFAADLAFFEKELPNYRFLERLRYGGQGVVYRVLQRSTERVVAIKLLLDDLLISSRQQARFVREVRLAARLRHPNIVAIYEAGIVGKRPYYVMEYVDGCAFDDYVLLHGLDARQTVGLLIKVCHAVHAAHQRGIIHRDLKPSNILVDERGEPKVLDFGLAKVVSGDGESDEDLSVAGRVVGTLPYLSPEQAVADEGQVDVRSDVYSLGIVLYQTITDQFPYPVEGPHHQVLANIAAREPVPLRKALRLQPEPDFATGCGVNDDLEKVLLKALAKNPKDRYQSVEALAADLERFCCGEAVEAKAHYRFYQLRKAVRRFRIPLAVAAGFILVLFFSQWAVLRAEQRRLDDARVAAIGLDAGGFVRLGTVYYDEGNMEKANGLFLAAVALKPEAMEDPAAASFRFDALYRLAGMNYEKGKPELARPYLAEAETLHQRLLALNPDEPQWQRFGGYLSLLRAADASSAESWTDAESHLDQAIQAFEAIFHRNPSNRALQLELARALGSRATPRRKQGNLEGALADLTEANGLLSVLHQADRENLLWSIELARNEAKLGVVRMAANTVEGDEMALGWFNAAEQRLRGIQANPESEGKAWSIGTILRSVDENQKAIEKRVRSRGLATTVNQGHREPPPAPPLLPPPAPAHPRTAPSTSNSP